MVAVKIPLVNVGTCVTAFTQVSANVCKGDGSCLMCTARGGVKVAVFADILHPRTSKPRFEPEFKPLKF